MRLLALLPVALLLTPHGFAQDLPAPLDAALARAEAEGPARYAFTMRFAAADAAPVTLRYHPEKGWQTLSGDPDALPDGARDALARTKEQEAVPGGLLYGDFREHLAEVTLTGETDDAYTYAFVPPEARERGMGGEDMNAMSARLVVSKEDGRLALYDLEALRPFKPLPIVRLDAFALEHEFARLDGEADGPAVLVRLRSVRRGSRMFQRVDEDFEATFTDHVRVD